MVLYCYSLEYLHLLFPFLLRLLFLFFFFFIFFFTSVPSLTSFLLLPLLSLFLLPYSSCVSTINHRVAVWGVAWRGLDVAVTKKQAITRQLIYARRSQLLIVAFFRRGGAADWLHHVSGAAVRVCVRGWGRHPFVPRGRSRRCVCVHESVWVRVSEISPPLFALHAPSSLDTRCGDEQPSARLDLYSSPALRRFGNQPFLPLKGPA